MRLSKSLAFIYILLFSATSLFSQTGPGGVGTTDGSSNLSIWLRADKNVNYTSLDSVSAWDDYSGSDNDLVNSPKKPLVKQDYLNSLPAIYFASDESGLQRSDVDRADLFSADANTILFVKNSTSGNTWFNWSFDASNTVSFDLSGSSTAFNFANSSLTGSVDVTSGNNIVFSTVDGSNQYIYLNNTQDATQSNTNTLGSETAGFYLGTNDGTASNGWTGYISEVLVYDRTLNSAERNILNNALSAKYDIALSANDYYAGDDNGNDDFDFDVVGIGAESDGSHTASTSAGVRIYENNSSLEAGDYVFIGHDNSVDSVTTLDCGGSLEQRWNRSWYLDKTGDTDVKISFDFSEGVGGGSPASADDYRLIYRSSNSGDFSEITVSSKGIENGDQVYFEVANTELNDGYYTIGTVDKENSPVDGSKTWYTYMNGDWDEWTTWTLDPDGSLLLNSTESVPGASDSVVVLNGVWVTVSQTGKAANYLEIRSGGIVDIGETSGHDFGSINGSGTLRLDSDDFPDGDPTDFVSKGTVEYRGGSTTYSISKQVEYYNLKINLDDAANTLILTDSITVGNNFTIQRGEFQINDNSSTDILTLDVQGDILIQENGGFTVGGGNTIGSYEINGSTSNLPPQGEFHDIFHQIYAYGDFTNNGTVSFTNQSAPDYNDFTDGGAVSLYMKGAADNQMKLYNTTDLYNLIIDKGSDQTYTLSLYSAESGYFTLFGPNSVGRLASGFVEPFSASDPEIRKALWIYHGTLKLTGNVNIPTLSEGNDHEDGEDTNGDYALGASGSLRIAGSNVEVYSTADDVSQVPTGAGGLDTGGGHQALGILGKLRITAGMLGTRNSGGIVYRPVNTGELVINGGSVNMAQFRSTSSGSGKFSYIQTGGIVTINGDGATSGSYGIFDLAESSSVFQMSGGTLNINDATGADDDFYINCEQDNCLVTGGAINIELGSGVNFGISSTTNLWNLNIENADASGTFTVNMNEELVISNDLFVDDYCTLDATANNNHLTVKGDFTLGNSTNSTADYNTRNNTTTFNGEKNSTITIANNTNISTLNLYDLVIDKDLSDYHVVFSSNKTSGDTIATVNDDIRIERGVFDYGEYLINVKDSVYVKDTLGSPSSAGRIILNGTAPAGQTIESSIIGNPYLGHAELNNDNGARLDGDSYFGQFTLTNGIINIGKYLMSLDTNEIFTSNTFDNTRMVKTAGNASDKGLLYNFSLSGDYSGESIVFPLGTDDNGNKYTPANILVNGTDLNDSGFFGVNPVPEEHPATNSNFLGEVLPYYWRTTLSGFESIANNSITLQYEYHSLISSSSFLAQGYRMYLNIDGEWYYSDGDDNDDFYILQYTEIGLWEGDFTTAEYGPFGDAAFWGYDTYYSYDGGGLWGNTESWSLDGHNDPNEPGNLPGDEDIAIIGDNDSIYINTNGRAAGQIFIRSGSVLDINSTINHDFTDIKGAGKFRTSTPDIPNADYDNLINNDTSVFEYYGANYGIQNTLSTYPNLWVTGNANSIKTLPDADMLIQRNLEIGDPVNTGATLMLSNNANGDIFIKDSIILSNGGKMLFPDDGVPRSVTIYKSIILNNNNDSITIASGGLGNEDHLLYVTDDIHLFNGQLVLHKESNRGVNLTFQGDSVSEITSTSEDTVKLHKLTIDKNNADDTVYINTPLTLDTSEISLILNKGVLVLNNDSIDITLSSGSQGEFEIPHETSLILRKGATARITGSGNGLRLSGKLSLEDSSQFILENNGYIEYVSSGTGEAVVNDNATLSIGGQFRRDEIINSGYVTYTQTGGTVTVGNNAAPTTNRGVFEVLNSSDFTFTGGDLIIARSQIETSPALFLDPETDNIAGGAYITIGNNNTPDGEVIGMYINVPVKNLRTVDPGGGNSFEAKIFTVAPTLDTLSIAENTTFNCNEVDLNLTGDFINYGTYNGNNNTTSFIGDRQYLDISGTATTNFYNLTFSNSDTAFINNDITVAGDSLNIASGAVVDDEENTITLLGDVNNSGVHYSSSTTIGGILFNGSERQEITGAGEFGRLEIDNTKGVALNNDLTIIDNILTLTNGSLYIRNHQFTMGVNSSVTGPFGENEMIVTNGAYSDGGVKRNLNSGTTNDILIPTGVPGKYTPVEMDITSSASGSFTVIPVNEAHRTVDDEDNVLQYYWSFDKSGITDIDADIRLNYKQEDVAVTGSNLESDYIPAYLKDQVWAKFDQSNVNTTNNTIDFTFRDASSIRGDFTAGISEAIPDTVPVYYTTSPGNWEDPGIWAIEGEGAASDYPNGHVVKIYHDVTITENLKSAYQTMIDTGAVLDVGMTIGHYLGAVSGYGHLKIDRGKLPAGDYDDFFACSGGSVEFSGSSDYTIPDEGSTYRRLVLSGSGTRVMPDVNITICDTLYVNGVHLDNSTHNNNITINGIFYLENGGSFDAGSGSATVIYSGSSQQNLGGFTGSNAFNNFTIDNASGISLTGNVDINGTLDLTDGVITTNGNTLTLANTGSVSPNGGKSSSYIDGMFSVEIDDGNSFAFPLGDDRWGKLELQSVNTSGTATWGVRYLDESHSNTTPGDGLAEISSTEYWQVTPPGEACDAKVQIRWDDQSDINGVSAGGVENIKEAQYDGTTQWDSVYTDISGTDYSGTATSHNTISFSASTMEEFTLASITQLLATANFASDDTTICLGETTDIIVNLTGNPDWTYKYTIDGGSETTVSNVSESPDTITTSTAGEYQLTYVEDADGVGTVDDGTVTVSNYPEVTANAGPNHTICSDSSITIGGDPTAETGTSPFEYLWSPTTDLNDETYANPTVTPTSSGITDYSVTVTDANGCSDTDVMTLTVNTAPDPEPYTDTNPICYDTGIDIPLYSNEVNGVTVNTYSWSPADSLDDASAENPNYQPSANPNAVSVSTMFYISIESTDGCVASDSLEVELLRKPETGDQYYIPDDFDQ